MDDTTQVATFVGTVIGAVASSFAATWFALIRPMKLKQAADEERPSQTILVAKQPSVPPRETRPDYGARVERLEDDVRRIEHALHEAVADVNDAVAKRLTTEEFQAYTTFVTSALHSLTEKVGEVRGQLIGFKGKGEGSF
jgi:hypothetical protein